MYGSSGNCEYMLEHYPSPPNMEGKKEVSLNKTKHIIVENE